MDTSEPNTSTPASPIITVSINGVEIDEVTLKSLNEAMAKKKADIIAQAEAKRAASRLAHATQAGAIADFYGVRYLVVRDLTSLEQRIQMARENDGAVLILCDGSSAWDSVARIATRTIGTCTPFNAILFQN